MRIGAGGLRWRCTVQRRTKTENTRGVARGDYAPVPGLTRISCKYRQLTVREAQLATATEGAIDAELRLRNCAAARTITNADRFEIHVPDGTTQGFGVLGDCLPDTMTGDIIYMLKRRRG